MFQRIIIILVLSSAVIASCIRPAATVYKVHPTGELSGQSSTAATDHPLPPTSPKPPPPTPTPQPEVRIHSAEQSLFNGDWELALTQFQSALADTQDPEFSAEAMLGIARSYLMGRNYYSAVDQLDKLIAEFPDSSQAANGHFFLAQIYEAQEKYGEAALQYRAFLEKKPGAIDAYIRNWYGDALFASGEIQAAIQEYQASLEAGSALDEFELRLKLANAYALDGDTPTALALYDDMFSRTNSDYIRALIDLRKGQIYSELGQMEEAHNAYLDAVNNYPKSYDSYLALVELVDANITVDELQRGIVDYYAKQYGPALTALNKYLQSNPSDPATAHYYYGLAMAAQGNFDEAIRHWDIVIEKYPDHGLWDEAWEMKGYTQWADLNLTADAVSTLSAFAQKAPGHARAAEFMFDAALAAERGSQLERAIELWEQLALTYPNSEYAPRSLYLAGLAQYRLKNYAKASDFFQRYTSIAVSLEDKAAGNFWNGKALNAAGNLESALAAWRTAAAIDPTGYYSERARDHLHDRGVFDPPRSYDLAFDLQAEKVKAEEWMRTTFNIPTDVDLSSPGDLVDDPHLRRGLELWGLGLYDEARGEFEVLRQYAAADPVKTFRLIDVFLQAGAYRSAIMAARQVLDLAGLNDTTSLSAPAYFNHIRFGTFFNDLILPLSQEYGFHPLLLFSLIRQESLFEGFVRSSAGARGLMQIIPRTGEEIASNLGWPEGYSDEDLYRPLVSLKLGIDYLNRQRKNFDGDLYAALAAYNGGPGNAMSWVQLAENDPDLFMEVIPFAETRSYIRRIYENFMIYRFIYSREQ